MAKKCIAFLLALAMLLSFAACASGEEEAPQGSGSPGESSEAENNGESKESLSGSVTMWTFLDVNADNGRSKVLKKLIEQFEKKTPVRPLRWRPRNGPQCRPKLSQAMPQAAARISL